jgi:hypothetical protein
VLRRLFTWLVTAASRRLEPALAPDEAIPTMIGFQSERLMERPTFPRILAREMIDPHAEHAQEHVGQLAGSVFKRICDLVEEGQKAGIFRRDLDPRFSALSAMSMVPYSHIVRPGMGLLLGGAGAATDEQMREYAAHAARFVLSALEARPPTGSGG